MKKIISVALCLVLALGPLGSAAARRTKPCDPFPWVWDTRRLQKMIDAFTAEYPWITVDHSSPA